METSPKNEILFEEKHSCIEYSPALNLIIVTSIGYQNLDLVKSSFTEVLNAIQTKKATKLLVDNSLVKGSFTDATDWITGTFFPKAIQAGINTVASIPSPDVFGKFAGTQVLNKVQGLAMQRFANKAEALQWVQSL